MMLASITVTVPVPLSLSQLGSDYNSKSRLRAIFIDFTFITIYSEFWSIKIALDSLSIENEFKFKLSKQKDIEIKVPNSY